MRHSSGLRNRYRTGKSTYSVQKKSRMADRYGQWQNGKRVTDDFIDGGVLRDEKYPRRGVPDLKIPKVDRSHE